MSNVLNKFPGEPGNPYVERGEGVFIFTEDGRKILDATAGWCSQMVLGYNRPEVLDAMNDQMKRFCHMDHNIWRHREMEELASLLLSRAPAGLNKVYFAGNSGSESVEAAHSNHSASAQIVTALGIQNPPFRIDSQCKYALVARGQADAYLRLPTRKGYVEKIWDHAAGSIIAQEAGVIVTDIHGNPLDFSHGAGLEKNRGVIAAVPSLHDRLIAAIDELEVGIVETA